CVILRMRKIILRTDGLMRTSTPLSSCLRQLLPLVPFVCMAFAVTVNGEIYRHHSDLPDAVHFIDVTRHGLFS
ncbi:hypothetical protein, partial [Citrobacter freundii]